MEPASIRTKNPGAMWPGPIATKWGSLRWIYLNDGTGQGGGGHGNKIAIFENWVDGISAQLDLWRSSPRYRNKPFAEAINIWCGGNSTEQYIKHVLSRIPSMTRNTIMNDAFWRSAAGVAFLKVQAAHEAGKVIPAPEDAWIAAQKRVMGGTTAPSVKSVTTSTAANTITTTTAVQAAHAGASPFQIAVILFVGVAIAGFAVWWFHFRKKPTPEVITEGQSRILVPDMALAAQVEMAIATPQKKETK